MSSAPPPGALQASNSANDQDPSANSLSWEGDRMFNIYIHDYCHKRGYRKTAQELMREADLGPDPHPPIDARQGLLFEWWSVFWVLFTAKANGSATGPNGDDAVLYTQHQAQQAMNRAARLPSAAGTAPGHPMSRPGVNGRPFAGVPMTNGVGPNPGAMNGMPGHAQAPSANPSTQPNPPPFAQPPLPGQPRNQLGAPRPTNGLFSSPTMAHSPQNTGAQGPQPPQPGPQPNQHPLSGRSPHQGAMPPPGHPAAPGQPSGSGPNQTPANAFQNTRPPSRSASPGQGNIMTQPSPSMANRQAVGMPGFGPMSDQQLMAELTRMNHLQLEPLKREVNIEVMKDLNSMNPDEKLRLVNAYRRRKPPHPSTATNLAAVNVMPPSNRLAPGPGPRPSKRASVAEEAENPPGASGSPPDSKRPRRSPIQNNPMYPQPMTGQPGQGGPPQAQMSNGLLKPGGMPGGPQPTPFAMQAMPGGPMGGGMGMTMGQPSMGVGPHMNKMGPMPGQGSMMGTPQMQPMGPQNQTQQYRQSLVSFHQNGVPTGMPGGSDPTFGMSMAGRPGGPSGPPFDNARKPPMNMLPASPSMNKDMKDGKPDGSPGNVNGRTPTTSGTAASTPSNNPAQPGPPLHQPGQGPTPNSNLNPNPSQSVDPSPASMLGGPMGGIGGPPAPGGPSADLAMFSTNFLDNLTGDLGEFGDNIFGRPDGDINFERDFGQWFNPDDISTGLDMKQ
ncbi:hypothetical protein VKT23_014983 [Stygiomarasmius scandens]|uniref:LisH domain-containing protein n=1 Tax=Marasmiellus scandens TaxID=2682957 RepID=A0ABR1IZ28_9AGAR